MKIRSATCADAAALVELWQRAGLALRPDHVPEELEGVLARDPELVLVAEDGGRIVAAVFGAFDGRRGWVNRLATLPGERGQGHATALLRELEQRLVAKGCRKLNLCIEAANAQVAHFYARHGYSTDELIFMEKWLR